MTTILSESGIDIDAEPHLREAAHALGYVKADASEWLAVKLIEYRFIGPAGHRIFERDDYDHALTERGRAEPAFGLYLTCERAKQNMHRERQAASFKRIVQQEIEFTGYVYVVVGRNWNCNGCKRLVGEFFPIEDCPRLPLPDCDEPVCQCQFLAATKAQLKSWRGW